MRKRATGDGEHAATCAARSLSPPVCQAARACSGGRAAAASAELARGIAAYAWQRDRYTGGDYALYRPGQWFTVRKKLAEPHGKVFFAGEHLADWQGFMEGAVVTGEAAVQEVMREARRSSGIRIPAGA